jgi:hypothetical protein
MAALFLALFFRTYSTKNAASSIPLLLLLRKSVFYPVPKDAVLNDLCAEKQEAVHLDSIHPI